MLRNNPGYVKDSVNEAGKVLSEMLNTHKCLVESGVEFVKRLESHPASKRMGNFRRPRSASLGDTPKKPMKDGREMDGESYAEILKAPRIQERRSSQSKEQGGRSSSWFSKRVVTSQPSRRS